MTFLIQQTLIYAVPLMIVALAGVFAERSGIINLALEGIMVFGAFIGVWFVRILQTSDAILSLKQSGNWVALQGVELLTMLVAAAFGALFSLLLSFASINLRADQTIGGTALNLMAPALVLFFIRIIANQNTLQMLTGDAASWFMIKKSTLGIDKNTDLGFFGETFVNKVYLATYVCILLFIILSILLYKTRFGLRLRACGENPQAADSLGINVYKMRYAGTTISGALAGMGGTRRRRWKPSSTPSSTTAVRSSTSSSTTPSTASSPARCKFRTATRSASSLSAAKRPSRCPVSPTASTCTRSPVPTRRRSSARRVRCAHCASCWRKTEIKG